MGPAGSPQTSGRARWALGGCSCRRLAPVLNRWETAGSSMPKYLSLSRAPPGSASEQIGAIWVANPLLEPDPSGREGAERSRKQRFRGGSRESSKRAPRVAECPARPRVAVWKPQPVARRSARPRARPHGSRRRPAGTYRPPRAATRPAVRRPTPRPPRDDPRRRKAAGDDDVDPHATPGRCGAQWPAEHRRPAWRCNARRA
jgi:hypothetical protein